MTAKSSRIEHRAKLVRLLSGLEFYRSWIIASIRQAKGEVTQEDLNQIVEPSENWLEIFDSLDDRGGRHILKDVQQWYAHTAADLNQLAQSGDPAHAAAVQAFLDAFRAEVGFDFQAEAGILAKLAKRAIKLGRIIRQSDYEALKELEVDQSQAVVDPNDMAKIAALLRAFETDQASG